MYIINLLVAIAAFHLHLAISEFPIIDGYECPREEIEATNCRGPTDCLYPNPNRCDRFIQCNDAGLAYDMPCAGNLQFNAALRQCDYPENAKCAINKNSKVEDSKAEDSKDEDSVTSPPSNAIIREDFNCLEAEASSLCAYDPLGDCVYVSPYSCTSYIECYDEVAYEVPCPQGTVYDSNAFGCTEPKESIDCTP